jgi:HisJ family histidinol phosphate phosphatase
MHTIFSDGKNSIEEMVKTASDIGLKTIAITDHIWKSSDWFDDYLGEIYRLRKEFKDLKILVGFEAKALSTNGEIDAIDTVCTKADIKLGAIHRIPKSEKCGEFLLGEEIKKDKNLAYINWLTTTKNMIKNVNVDIVAHPCMVLDRYNIEVNINDIVELFNLANQYNAKLEISSRYKKSNIYLLKVLEKNPYFINLISYGSDSHSMQEMQKVSCG